MKSQKNGYKWHYYIMNVCGTLELRLQLNAQHDDTWSQGLQGVTTD